MQTDRELDRVAMLAPHLGNPCADRYEQLGAPSALPLPQLGYRGYAPRFAMASRERFCIRNLLQGLSQQSATRSRPPLWT